MIRRAGTGRKPGYREPEQIKDVISGVIRGLKKGVRGRRGELERLRAAWPEVVGQSIAGRSRIVAVDQGHIRIEVASAALKHDLATFRRTELLEQLKERLPDLNLRKMTVRVGSL